MNQKKQTTRRFPVIAHKGKYNRPVVKADFPKTAFPLSSLSFVNFNGAELDEPHLFRWLYLQFSDDLESFVFASMTSGGYLVDIASQSNPAGINAPTKSQKGNNV
ncbi:hypothetical protein KKI24_12745 [bacterium]|nr:hypothetical protein [bacterium]